ncbi:Crp/Fnr family transcriptional regulator [Mariniphaga sediminis]|uniref:Crp/Fnr family transcriptional regulator n=1 Tax=Mariniphaga sediminis TaxID=1628158 RepID=A0A399CWA2_9BACT|nr:Crp/Fnr family transcriptional regulator [Mariniphaga sediminis]RIH63503.1 Crp/Fnr family transcriptional regulator [Mariniphaga sediminis]
MSPEFRTYQDYLSSFDIKVSDLLGNFFNHLSILKLKKNNIYLSENTIPNELGFIVNGLMRSYIIDENGNERTINFFTELNYVGDYQSLISKTPTMYVFQCLENTTLIQIPYTALEEGYNQNPVLEKHGRILAEKKLSMQNNRIKTFLTQTAEQRYLSFIRKNPGLFNRISLTHLSSYLGIERQSLTRIRKKLASF